MRAEPPGLATTGRSPAACSPSSLAVSDCREPLRSEGRVLLALSSVHETERGRADGWQWQPNETPACCWWAPPLASPPADAVSSSLSVFSLLCSSLSLFFSQTNERMTGTMVVGWSIINKDNVQVQVQPLTGSEGSLSLLHLGLGGSGALLEHVGKTALAAVLPVVVPAHENSGAALGRGALAPQALDLRRGERRISHRANCVAPSLRSGAGSPCRPSQPCST